MPKAWRKCSMCPVDSFNRPDLVIFSTQNKNKACPKFICELHYLKEDMRPHQDSKRLVAGAVPTVPPLNQDHDQYVRHSATTQIPDIGDILDDDYEDEISDCVEEEEAEMISDTESFELPSSLSIDYPTQSSFVPSSQQSKSNNSDFSNDYSINEQASFSGAAVIVMWTSLLQLLCKCVKPGCGAAVLPDNMKLIRNGAAIKVHLHCNDGHDEVWESCSGVKATSRQIPIINLSVACYVLFSGIHWSQFKAFCDKLGIIMISTSTFYRYLSNLIYKCTYEFWLRDQARTINEILRAQEYDGVGARVAGDGRFDSPGWSAKFCNYFMQDLASRKVLALMVACKDQVGVKYSAEMEVFALRSLLHFLKSSGINTTVLVTDRSTTVRAMISTEFPQINHQFDIWL